jgi:hypothetical protein
VLQLQLEVQLPWQPNIIQSSYAVCAMFVIKWVAFKITKYKLTKIMDISLIEVAEN